MTEDPSLPLIVILGPTASGKSAVAVELARALNGEIICADSRTVYRGMSIGTAKPSPGEMQGVPHWAVDLVDPNQRFTLYDFQKYALRMIDEIRNRRHVPMLVGGTGLYIDCILYNYRLVGGDIDKSIRDRLERMSTGDLIGEIKRRGGELPKDTDNKRRLVRALELGMINRDRSPLRGDVVVIGIKTSPDTLKQRIACRGAEMLSRGIIDEVSGLDKKYGDSEPLRRNIYGVVKRYLFGEISYKQIIDEIVKTDYKLARKQLTYWRSQLRSGDIWWMELNAVENLAMGGDGCGNKLAQKIHMCYHACKDKNIND